jgi:hypothetical protein
LKVLYCCSLAINKSTILIPLQPQTAVQLNQREIKIIRGTTQHGLCNLGEQRR